MADGPGADRRLSARLSARLVGLALVVAGSVALAVLAVLLVPWQPVPGGMPAPVAPRTVFSPEEIARGEAYASMARLIGWSSLAISLVVSGWLGFTRRGARVIGWIRLPWPLAVLAGTAVVLLAGTLATLPVAVLAWQRRRAFGLTEQSLAGLLRDQAVSWGVAVAFSGLALLLLVAAARWWPRWWPAVAGLLAAGLVVASTYLYPVLVEPAFNHFTPLPEGRLHDRIERLARAEGVRVDEVLVADASRRTTSLNAYVSGFGDSRRVVVYDTLLELPDAQILSVVAHELAHARHGDVETGAALGAVGSLVGVGLLALVVESAAVRRRAGVAGLADPRAVALVLALGAFGALAMSPVENAVSRRVETRADVDALKATGDPVAFMEMQRSLAIAAVADPTPPAWAQWWFGSHPTVLERIAVARLFLG